MTFVFKDRVRESWSGTGTGNITPAGAPDSSYQSIGSVMANGDTSFFTIFGVGGFETVLCTWNGTSLVRDATPLESSNSGSPVNFGAGVKTVIMTLPAAKALPLGTGAFAASVGGLTGVIGLGTGLQVSGNNIGLSATKFSTILGSDVALNNTANYFDVTSVAQGSTGVFLAIGWMTLVDTSSAAAFIGRISDGTNVYSSARVTSTGANNPTSMTLVALATNPAGNLRTQVRDSASTSGSATFNNSGNSKDSGIIVIRIG